MTSFNEIKDTLAYLRLVANRADDAAFERAVNTPTRGIGDRTLDQVRQRARDAAAPLWEAVLIEIAEGGLAGRAKNALRGFVELIERLANETREMALAEQIEHVLQHSGLREHLRQSGEITAMRGEHVCAKTQRAQSRFGLW